MEIVVVLIFMGFVGLVVGGLKGRAGLGFLLGLVLGPIGWIISALLPADGPKCPECLGVVAAGARKCKNCGSSLARY